MPEDWRTELETSSLGLCLRACLVYESVAQHMAGQPVEVTESALKVAARAEGLDTRHPWIADAAVQMARENDQAFA